jgi:Ran GTPase-activating protein (RanGAP) involved in mRNA processing and transport
MLAVSDTLAYLDIWGNGISEKGAAYIGRGLRGNTGLGALNIGRNLLSVEGVPALMDALTGNQTLALLNLRENYM